MPVKTVRKDFTAQVWQQLQANKKRILKDTVEEMRGAIVPNMRVDTGAQRKGVYIKGPGFNDYDIQQTEAAVLYEGKPGDAGRVMKLSEEIDIDDDDTAAVGASTGHTVEWELGLGVPAEPVFIPAADDEFPKFIQRVEQEYID